MTLQQEYETTFVNGLHALLHRRDRGALAALRRGLSVPPGAAPETYPYVVPLLPGGASIQEEDAYFMIASLFGLWHQGGGRQDISHGQNPSFNLGASLAELTKRRTGALEGVERRFTALLDARRADLPNHLRHVVSLLKTEGIAVNWLRLLRDVRDWDFGRRVQRAWARSFWGDVASDNQELLEDSGSETE